MPLTFANKKRIFSCFMAVTLLFCAIAWVFLYVFSGDNSNERVAFSDEITSVLAEDDYSGIAVSKQEVEEKGAEQVANDYNLTTEETGDASSETAEDPRQTFTEMGYTVFDRDDNYILYTKFYLKRLIVMGDYSQSYGASKELSGTEYSLLCYDSEEQTAYAYEQLLASGTDVVIDSVVMTAEDSQAAEYTYNYDNSYFTWGAEAMEVGPYMDYLSAASTSQTVVVAVLDTGINTAHDLFSGRFLYDSNGKIIGKSYATTTYDYSGYEFEDDFGHGTHVSGIICDLTPSNVKILPIRVLGTSGSGSVSSIISGLNDVLTYADTYNVVSINMSLCSGYSAYDNTNYETLFTKLRAKGVLGIAAAGNDATDVSDYLPANCSNVITVSALKKNDDGTYDFDSSYSNYGSAVDIVAPGTSITSAYKSLSNTQTTDIYAILSGTSMATPHVSAAVALLCLDKYYWNGSKPTYTADVIENELLSYAKKLTSGNYTAESYQGKGMLSLADFVKKTQIDITIDIADQSSVYGDSFNLDQTGYTMTAASSSIDTSKVAVTLYTAAAAGSSVGEYNIYANVVKSGTAANYTVLVNGGTYSITKRPVTISLDDQSSVYGEQIKLDKSKYTITSGSVVAGDDLELTLNTAAVNRKVGSSDIYVSGANGNYDVTCLDGVYTVEKRPITIALSEQTGVYGDTVSLNNSAYTVTSGSIVYNDSLSVRLTTTADSSSGVGDYPIAVNESKLNGNYDVTYTAAEYEVTKRPVSVTAADQTINYGDDFTFDDTLYTVHSGDIVNGDNLCFELTCNATAKSGVGTYAITCKCTQSDSNYQVTTTNATLTIAKRKVTVRLLDQTLEYSDKVVLSQSDYVVTNGNYDGIDLSTLVIKTNVTSYVQNRTYTIVGEAHNKNYDITFINGTLSFKDTDSNTAVAGITGGSTANDNASTNDSSASGTLSGSANTQSEENRSESAAQNNSADSSDTADVSGDSAGATSDSGIVQTLMGKINTGALIAITVCIMTFIGGVILLVVIKKHW